MFIYWHDNNHHFAVRSYSSFAFFCPERKHASSSSSSSSPRPSNRTKWKFLMGLLTHVNGVVKCSLPPPFSIELPRRRIKGATDNLNMMCLKWSTCSNGLSYGAGGDNRVHLSAQLRYAFARSCLTQQPTFSVMYRNRKGGWFGEGKYGKQGSSININHECFVCKKSWVPLSCCELCGRNINITGHLFGERYRSFN